MHSVITIEFKILVIVITTIINYWCCRKHMELDKDFLLF
jgi:hypothetical protein